MTRRGPILQKPMSEKNTPSYIDGGNFIVRKVEPRKTIALVAHDNKKAAILKWAEENREVLESHDLVGTGTTGQLVAKHCGLKVSPYLSGPLGGDQQIGADISQGKIDLLIFFWDPLSAQPHDPDIKALLRLAVLYNIPTACNKGTADFMVRSEYFHSAYDHVRTNYERVQPDLGTPR